MGGQMGQIGMQFLPEVLDKFPDSIPHVGHQGITGILHVNPKLYLRKRAAWLQPMGSGRLASMVQQVPRKQDRANIACLTRQG